MVAPAKRGKVAAGDPPGPRSEQTCGTARPPSPRTICGAPVSSLLVDSPASLVCYRHPDRPTRLACSECGKYICVDCSHDSVVGQRCPDCARPKGRATIIDGRTALRRTVRSSAPVTFALIAVNVGIFLLGELSPDLGSRLFRNGAQWQPAIDILGEWYRAFTAMFLHGGITHVLFNMYALFIFGPVLERRFGSVSFAALYVASGLGGSALYHLIGGTNPAVGASGAIFGLFGAMLAASYRQRHTPAGQAVFRQLGLLLVINMALPFIVPNIAWEAHVGGLAVGAGIAFIWDNLPLADRASTLKRTVIALGFAMAAILLVIFL